jgi:MoaA/NifB/PqqE/SkfB family radical SAM enzyme
MHDTWPLLQNSDFFELERGRTTTLQRNLGYRCNLSCIYCHVNAGPRRTETMHRDTMQLAMRVAEHLDVNKLDLTGGSSELKVDFRWLVAAARRRGLKVMDRLNPTICEGPGYEWVNCFLAEHAVEVVT